MAKGKARTSTKKGVGRAPMSVKARLSDLLELFGPNVDQDWFDSFFQTLSQRIQKINSAEECVLFYVSIESFEREMENGGIAQALSNLGDSQVIGWCLQGYRFFNKPKSAIALKKAIDLAKKDAAIFQAMKNTKGKAGIDIYVKYRARRTFTSLEREFRAGLLMSNQDRVSIIKKYRKYFSNL